MEDNMKINQIIKEKRKHLGLTQENIAEYLGVSTPAVSKWENRLTFLFYPTISLIKGNGNDLSRHHTSPRIGQIVKDRFEYSHVL